MSEWQPKVRPHRDASLLAFKGGSTTHASCIPMTTHLHLEDGMLPKPEQAAEAQYSSSKMLQCVFLAKKGRTRPNLERTSAQRRSDAGWARGGHSQRQSKAARASPKRRKKKSLVLWPTFGVAVLSTKRRGQAGHA